MDYIDQQIIEILKNNSRLSNKEIGLKIHMTGQAVGNRITRLIESRDIINFTITQRHNNTQFIRLFLNGPCFGEISKVTCKFSAIENTFKVSGESCYMIVAHFHQEELNNFLAEISKYARYSIETVLN